MNIVPGVGIPEVAAIGMHTQDIARNTQQPVIVRASHEAGLLATMQDLGIFWKEDDSREGIGCLYFLIDGSAYYSSCPLSRLSRFRGKLLNSVSFAHPRALNRKRVSALFGEPERVFNYYNETNDILPIMERYNQACRNHQSTSVLSARNVEFLSYPKRGIKFYLQDGVVTEIEITKKE